MTCTCQVCDQRPGKAAVTMLYHPDATLAVVVSYDPPPIPLRQYDYVATRIGYEPGDAAGHGATEQDAIDDLEAQETERMSGPTTDDCVAKMRLMKAAPMLMAELQVAAAVLEACADFLRVAPIDLKSAAGAVDKAVRRARAAINEAQGTTK